MRRLAVGIVALGLAGCGAPDTPAERLGAPVNGIRFLADTAEGGFELAREPRPLRFPADHGSHPAYRTEWWYFTGNLQAEDGRHFGFELTFFRLGLTADAQQSGSAWSASDAWMAHFAVTDTDRNALTAYERFARGALGLAGATAEPLRIWVEAWSVTGSGEGGHELMNLRAAEQGLELTLQLRALKPPVAHGVDGLDAKGPEPGNASYYYSLTRLDAVGTLAVRGEELAVGGSAWMDREWSTSALSPGVVGWDWFALQLDDGRDLMWYRLRRADGSASPFSGGSLIERDGTRRALGPSDVALTPLAEWRSRATGVRYPVRWRMEIPNEDLSLVIEPYVDAQELVLSVRYWEGAVRVTGDGVGGQGYLELAGY